MANDPIFTGKSVDEAIADGLRALGLTADSAEIEIISRGSRGIFGLGSEPAQVRITPRAAKSLARTPPPPAPEVTSIAAPVEEVIEEVNAQETVAQEPVAEAPASTPATPPKARAAVESDGEDADAESGEESSPEEEAELGAMAIEMLGEMVRLMGFEADIIAEWRDPDADNEHRYLLLDLQGSELGALIGRRGDTLNNIQYLIRLMVNQRVHKWKNIVVDVEGYRQRRIDHLSQLAQRSASQVAQSGRPLSLEPMPANERRIVHLTLRDNPDVYTESVGDGPKRKVQILPKRS
ncbi:MAG: protein jag [Caldilineaceae bacterium]|nr:protein jag [Caldilineaceae bacterium]